MIFTRTKAKFEDERLLTATNFKPQPSTIIIGAGPVGLFTAHILATAGCAVRIIDDGRRGAGWASGGMLGAAYEMLGHEDLSHDVKIFARASQMLWSQFLAHVKAPFVAGSIFVARNDEEHSRLANLKADDSVCDTLVSYCDVPPGIAGLSALHCPTDIAFDPRTMLDVLRRQCANQGVGFVEGSVTQVSTGKVVLSDGHTLAADHVIVATGQAGNALAQSVRELSSLSLVKGQMMAIGNSGVALDRVIRAGRIYLIPRGDTIIVGATANPDDANADIIDLPSHSALQGEAIALCPALARGQVVESWAGMRPMTPDGLPLVGPSHVAGVTLACGTYRNGWLLAAGIANSIMASIGQEPQSAVLMQLFAPNRFSTTR
jgi:glycine oxidase